MCHGHVEDCWTVATQIETVERPVVHGWLVDGTEDGPYKRPARFGLTVLSGFYVYVRSNPFV